MKVVHLVTSLDFGGLERRMEILSKYPSGSSDVSFCALGCGGVAEERMVANGSRVTLLRADVRIFRIRTLVALAEQLRREKPDVIHTHGCEANFYGAIAARAVGVKHVIAEEIGVPGLSRLGRLAFRVIYKLCDAVVVMSPAVGNYMVEAALVESSKIRSVYNPVLLSKARRQPAISRNSPLKFIFVGRLEPVKNPDGLLEAFARLLADGRSVELSIVGSGSLSDCLHAQVSELGLEASVKIVGFVSDPLNIVIEHHVVVQPSHTEGFSLALIEAMSCGLPAVATPSGSAPALIRGRGNGWLAESSSIDALYRALSQACDDVSNICAMGARAADSVAGLYDAAAYSDKLDAFYHEVCK